MSDVAYEHNLSNTSDNMADASLDDCDPKPSHYLARSGDKYTPLIPVDELPSHIKIVGVPTYIDQEDLLRLQGTGCFPAKSRAAMPYEVDILDEEDQGGSPSAQPAGGPVNVPNTQTRDVSLNCFNTIPTELTLHRPALKRP